MSDTYYQGTISRNSVFLNPAITFEDHYLIFTSKPLTLAKILVCNNTLSHTLNYYETFDDYNQAERPDRQRN